MKRTNRLWLTAVLFSVLPGLADAQLTTLPSGGNPRASVYEQVGLTDITIHYNRPGVKGREGKIWGELVPYGYTDPGFGLAKSAPWRAGANENTVIRFSTDVVIEGKPLPAGEYALLIDVQPETANIIFNKNTKAWGTYFYKPEENVLAVPVKTNTLAQSQERLSFEFLNQKENSAVIALQWEKRSFPFTVEVDAVKNQLNLYRGELTGQTGFRNDVWAEAIQFCVSRNVNLEEALQWSDYALNGPFFGTKNFGNYKARAEVLNALGRSAEADAAMAEAMKVGDEGEVHQYARQLLAQGKKDKAVEVFKLNAKNHPNVYTTNMGLVRAYSAQGDYKNAIKYLKVAQTQAPGQAGKDQIAKMMVDLQAGKNIN